MIDGQAPGIRVRAPGTTPADGGGLRVDVALVPAQARRWNGAVRIVVDELRASSTIVTALDRGATAVVPAANVAEARRFAAPNGDLLAGERNIVTPPRFDFGNSPVEIGRADLVGRTLVLSTRNGTAVLRSLRGDGVTLIGCLLNATACADAALAIARASGVAIGIVCAGRFGGFTIDDALTAGCLAERLLAAADGHVELTDAAAAALQLWQTTPDLAAAFDASTSGRLLAGLHLAHDTEACLAIDSSTIVPVLVPGVPTRIERLIN
jgi:2-phosphosulfolactate phosphatase